MGEEDAPHMMISTPVKSPAAKKSRGDDGYVGEDVEGEMSGTGSSGGRASSTAVTMEGISALLDNKMGPMQQSMKSLEHKMGELNVSVDERLGQMEQRMETADIRITKLEQQVLSIPTSMIDPKVAENIKEIEKEIYSLKHEPPQHAQTTGDAKELTAVIGGLWGLDNMHEAEVWVRDKLWSIWAPDPAEVYVKGDYKNLVFARFRTKDDRDAAVQGLRGTKEGKIDIWAKEALPLEDRIRRSMLLGVKYMLGNWGFKKNLMEVDSAYTSLKCDKKVVLTVEISAGGVECKWDGGWQSWTELQESEELKQLIINASEQVKKGNAGKGFAKGGPQ